MRLRLIAVCLMAAAVLAAADKKDDSRFAPGPASSYASKQTNDGVTIAVVSYDADDLAHTAFGKLNPYQHGVLPVLIIIQNDTDRAMRLDGLRAEYLGIDRTRVDATPANEVRYVGQVPKRPTPGPLPAKVLFKHKNPLDEWEIEGHAFAAKMLPPHESAHGFLYFQAKRMPGDKIYLTGITEAGTGKGLFYFEIPFDK